MDNTRKQFLMTLTDYEKQLFTKKAMYFNWSIGKFLRVSAKVIILMQRNKSMTLEEAMLDASRQDANTKLEL